MAGFETIEVEVADAVATLTLNRPHVRNAVDDAMRSELAEAVARIHADDGIRVVILTGAGPAFCAGGDIAGMQQRLDEGERAPELGWRRQRAFHHTVTRLYELDRPVIAAVNGAAFGLGLDLALACDFILLADDAALGESFVHRGLVPDGGGMFHLPRRVGLARAKELIYTGRRVEPAEAERIGLADRVVPAAELTRHAREFARALAAQPPVAQALAKSILNRSSELDLAEVNALGSAAQAICYATPEHRDSVRAFLAERAAKRQAASSHDAR
ncbi:MAG: enoyl-CoA hydratase/isomerase family protein [Microbacterium sp.]|uniref:enoyl-CoA hydratase/isomerase family protein n=1 Tax=Microbacterium sp. TaxID=51671 RepID=UPI0039E7183C